MKHKQGFTLTEILLAVMIVGVIGVALASLTTAASRESEVGRSRALLRNDLTIALQQIKEDINNYNTVLYAAGPVSNCTMAGTCYAAPSPLLLLAKNTDLNGNAFTTPNATAYPVPTPEYVIYCFKGGNEVLLSDQSTPVQPQGYAVDGGIITRRVISGALTNSDWEGSLPHENLCTGGEDVILNNVKFIHPSYDNNGNYPVPLFQVEGWSGGYSVHDNDEELEERMANVGGQLKINLILELPSFPVVNQAVEVVFSPGNGYADSRVNN